MLSSLSPAPLPRPAGVAVPTWSLLGLVDPRAALVGAFLAGRNARTMAAYGRDLADFRAFLAGAGRPTADLDDAARVLLAAGQGGANALALAYRASLLDRRLAPATVNRRLAALRSLVTLARTLGVVPWALDVAGVTAERYRDTRGPGRAGVAQLVAQLAARPDAKGRRDLAAVRLLYDLALRRAEVLALDVADVDLAAGTVAVVGKGRTERARLTLPAPTRAALAAWLAVRGAAPGPLFLTLDPARKGRAEQGRAPGSADAGRLTGRSLHRIVRAVGDAVGIVARPHGLRHAAITDALERTNGNVADVAQFSRHRDVRTVLVYNDRRADVGGALAALVAGGV